VIAGQDRIHIRAQPGSDIDRGVSVVDHPDEAVPLLTRHFHQTLFFAVDLAEVASRVTIRQRSVRIVGPSMIRAGEKPGQTTFLALLQ